MIEQATYKREKRRLALAQNRFAHARSVVPQNPYSSSLQGEGLAALQAAIDSAHALERVAGEGLATFEQEGYPDSWANWERAQDDARFYLQRYELSPLS